MTGPSTLATLRELITGHPPASSPAARNATAEPVLAALGVPSVSVGILEPTGAISADCFSSLGHTSNTVFQACSISKPVACMAAMRLVAHGKLDPDAVIGTYLAKETMSVIEEGPFATPATREMVRRITVEQLMSHRAGLTVHGFEGYPQDRGFEAVPSAIETLRGKPPANNVHVGMQCFPGYSVSYSGGGMTVLQLVLEAVGKKPFPQLMKELVFGPLGMTRSFYGPPSEGEDFGKAYSTGYQICNPEYNLFDEHVAAGLWTTPTDLLQVVRAMQVSLREVPVTNSGEEQSFLPLSLARRMVSEIDGGFALAWVARKTPGIAIEHTGSNSPGYFCWLIGYADIAGKNALADDEVGCGLCVMTNAVEGSEIMVKVASAIQHLRGWRAIQLLKQWRVLTAFATSHPPDPTWKNWIGTWGTNGDLEIVRSETDDRPYMRFKDLPEVKLRSAAQAKAADNNEAVIWLVADGMRVMLCLREKDDARVVELWNEGPGNIDTLERKTS